MFFNARSVHHGDWMLVSVVGDLDLATLPEFRASLDALDGPAVGLALTDVGFLDVVVVGVLLGAQMRAHRRQASFSVVCPDGPVRSLLAEARIDHVVTVVATTGELPPVGVGDQR
ncbi:MAG: STAS domain-containing protein [Actinomycetes bacterium]